MEAHPYIHCFQEQRMEGHPYILARVITVSRNKEWKHIDTFLPGPSIFPGTKKGSIFLHSCLDLHCFHKQIMDEVHL